jgi:hypothetical protein
MSKRQFDITEVTRQFLANQLPERYDLIREFREWVATTNQGKMFVAEVCGEALMQKAMPTDLAGIALMYGMALGVSLERHRITKQDS